MPNEKTPGQREVIMRPIGLIHTPYTNRSEAPHQPGGFGETSRSTIELFPGMNFDQALEDLDGMEKIWIITWFDRNTNWKPKAQVPRGEKLKRGVFATRSPYRPNPIGLTLVDLISVNGRTLTIGSIDLLDGTPVLDIKPYLPYSEAFPDAKSGWIPKELDSYKLAEYAIEYSKKAEQQLQFLEKNFSIDLRTNTERFLRNDPAPHPYRRISNFGSFSLIAIRSWRLRFKVEDHLVTITSVRSGYPAEVLANPSGPIHDEAAHRGFHAKWAQSARAE